MEKEKRINFRCDPDQYKYFKDLAQGKNIKLSTLMRSLPKILKEVWDQLDNKEDIISGKDETIIKLNMKNRVLQDRIDKLQRS